jgi:L-ascorbate metabolism protein UlaG (beta-lactamase superfamily)
MIYLLAIPIIIVLIFQIVGHLLSAPKYEGPVSDHFDGKKFINPGNAKAQGLRAVLKWMLNRERGVWKENKNFDAGTKPEESINRGTRITFINHTTFLIQSDGLNILTDPVYSERVSPFSFAGPRRMQHPGVRFEDLPKIDLILLSHNHYDHLDIHTVLRLWKTFDPMFIVPLGVGKFLQQNGIIKVAELDWWQTFSIASFNITCTPAQHFSGRGFFDRDATLWCGYMVESKTTKLCFVGDTGYNEITFRQIAERFKIDLAIIPIGAYKPLWFMSPVHCSPEEAVKIHLDLRAKQSIASHFGTFPLGDEGQSDPVRDLHRAMEKFGLGEKDFIALKEGASKDYNTSN